MAIYSISDRWLWLGFGVFFLLAARGIQHAISDTVRLIELPSNEGRKKKDSKKQPEDSISLESLRVLASSPNPSIRTAAASLVITRFASLPNATELITSDYSSKDPEVSRQASQAIKYLQDWDEELTSGLPISPLDEDYLQSPLARLETLTSLEMENREDREQQLQMAARFVGMSRGYGVDEDEEERRRRRREVALIHEGPGRVGERDLFRPTT